MVSAIVFFSLTNLKHDAVIAGLWNTKVAQTFWKRLNLVNKD